MAPKQQPALIGQRVKFLFDNMVHLIGAAMSFSLPSQPNFTVGSVVGSAPEAVAIFKNTKDSTDHWRSVATALLDVAKALDHLDGALRAAIGAQAFGAHPQAQMQPPVEPAPIPLPDQQQQQLVLAVPLRQRAGEPRIAPPPPQPVPAWPVSEFKGVMDENIATLSGYLKEAWASTIYFRRLYSLLAFLFIKIIPTLALWMAFSAGLVLCLAFLADPLAFAKAVIIEVVGSLSQLPRLGKETIVELVQQAISELFGQRAAASWQRGHCPEYCKYNADAAEAAGATHYTFNQQHMPNLNAYDNRTGTVLPHVVYMPASPPPTNPTGSDWLAAWVPAISCAVVGWALQPGAPAHAAAAA